MVTPGLLPRQALDAFPRLIRASLQLPKPLSMSTASGLSQALAFLSDALGQLVEVLQAGGQGVEKIQFCSGLVPAVSSQGNVCTSAVLARVDCLGSAVFVFQGFLGVGAFLLQTDIPHGKELPFSSQLYL